MFSWWVIVLAGRYFFTSVILMWSNEGSSRFLSNSYLGGKQAVIYQYSQGPHLFLVASCQYHKTVIMLDHNDVNDWIELSSTLAEGHTRIYIVVLHATYSDKYCKENNTKRTNCSKVIIIKIK